MKGDFTVGELVVCISRVDVEVCPGCSQSVKSAHSRQPDIPEPVYGQIYRVAIISLCCCNKCGYTTAGMQARGFISPSDNWYWPQFLFRRLRKADESIEDMILKHRKVSEHV